MGGKHGGWWHSVEEVSMVVADRKEKRWNERHQGGEEVENQVVGMEKIG